MHARRIQTPVFLSTADNTMTTLQQYLTDPKFVADVRRLREENEHTDALIAIAARTEHYLQDYVLRTLNTVRVQSNRVGCMPHNLQSARREAEKQLATLLGPDLWQQFR